MSELLDLTQTPVQENVPNDAWENTIRKYGIINACEWFGHTFDSDFTQETIRWLADRTLQDKEKSK